MQVHGSRSASLGVGPTRFRPPFLASRSFSAGQAGEISLWRRSVGILAQRWRTPTDVVSSRVTVANGDGARWEGDSARLSRCRGDAAPFVAGGRILSLRHRGHAQLQLAHVGRALTRRKLHSLTAVSTMAALSQAKTIHCVNTLYILADCKIWPFIENIIYCNFIIYYIINDGDWYLIMASFRILSNTSLSFSRILVIILAWPYLSRHP